MGNGVCARPLAAPSGFARTLWRLCFAKLLASLVGGPDGFAAGASRAQATRRLPARANGARPRNAAGLSCGVPPPERARQRVGQKVAWMLHPVTSVTTRERPSPRAAASFRPSAHDKPQRHENHLRGARKRPLRGLHEKRMGRLRRVARNCPLRGRHEKHTKSARGGYTGGDNRAWATRKTHGLFATCIWVQRDIYGAPSKAQ